MTDDVIIYHNPDCGTSRNTLGLIRNAGIEPHVIEYLKTPPSRRLLKSLTERMGVSVREVVRVKGTPYHELGLDDPKLTDDQLLDDMALLVKHDASEVGIDESFSIRTVNDGRWLGRGIRQRGGGRALNVRTRLAE